MYLEIEGLKIYYEKAGEGSPVLLLHGWGCSTATMAPVSDALKDSYTVYSLDFPGHGQSSMPENIMNVFNYARIARIFIERLGIQGCDVIAHSFGGRVTIILAAQNNLFNKIILCDAAGVRPKRTLRYYYKVYSYKLLKRLSNSKLAMRLFSDCINKKVQNAGSDDYKKLNPVMRATFSNVVNQDLKHLLNKITAPTLLVWGTEDKETPLYMAKIMEKRINDSGLVVFNGAGHYSYLERLGEFIRIAKHFFSGGTA